MTLYDVIRAAILDFAIFLESQKIAQTDTNSRKMLMVLKTKRIVDGHMMNLLKMFAMDEGTATKSFRTTNNFFSKFQKKPEERDENKCATPSLPTPSRYVREV